MKRHVTRVVAQPLLALSVILFILLLVAGEGCEKVPGDSGGGAQPTIGMNATNFTIHSITVPVGKPVLFDNTVGGGGIHILCVGTGTGGSDTCDSAN